MEYEILLLINVMGIAVLVLITLYHCIGISSGTSKSRLFVGKETGTSAKKEVKEE